LGPYHPVQLIAVGGMAEVYRVLEMREGVPADLVVKRVRRDLARKPLFLDMFRREARYTSAASHDNVVQVLDWHSGEDGDLLVLEYLDGCSVRDLLDVGEGALPPELAALVTHQIACGLERAYQAVDEMGSSLALVHRDVSPCNVVITRDGRVKLLDFGIAKSLTASEADDLTRQGNVKGKLGYMAPEQLQGLPVGPRVDQFAVGVVLYEMLVGRRLFDTRLDIRELRRRRWKDVPPPSAIRDVPAGLEDIVLRLIRPEQSERFSDWSEARVALEDFLFPALPEAVDLQAFVETMRAIRPFGDDRDTDLAIL
jgi:serine/threonine protein kinase